MGLAGAEIEAKRDAATASGAKVAELKKAKATKDEILAEVAVLKKLKAEVTTMCETALATCTDEATKAAITEIYDGHRILSSSERKKRDKLLKAKKKAAAAAAKGSGGGGGGGAERKGADKKEGGGKKKMSKKELNKLNKKEARAKAKAGAAGTGTGTGADAAAAAGGDGAATASGESGLPLAKSSFNAGRFPYLSYISASLAFSAAGSAAAGAGASAILARISAAGKAGKAPSVAVPGGASEVGPASVSGDASVARFFARVVPAAGLYGTSPREFCEIEQWFSLAADSASINAGPAALQMLNAHLRTVGFCPLLFC